MQVETLTELLGAEICSSDEETFDLFAQDLPSQNLGFVDSKAATLELTVAGLDLTIHQSPGVLSSSRAGGTTGAVVWKITPLFAEWLAGPDNPLFFTGVLGARSAVLELGCGISGIVGLVLAPRVARYVLTDQPYVSRFVEQNLAENAGQGSGPSRRLGKGRRSKETPVPRPAGPLRFAPLDWELDEVTPSLTGSSEVQSFDAVLACDCVYNEALIDPLVSACADVCRLRAVDGGEDSQPCVCVVAQQLRDPEIFEGWLDRFLVSFRTWRVPDAMLAEALRSGRGFVVHVGLLR